MKKSKLSLALALVLALTLIFTACGSEDNVRGEIAVNQSPTENITGNITIQDIIIYVNSRNNLSAAIHFDVT